MIPKNRMTVSNVLLFSGNNNNEEWETKTNSIAIVRITSNPKILC